MDDAPRVTAEDLKRRIEAGEELVVLDVRRGSWHRSDVKIAGALRLELEEVLRPQGRLSPEVPVVAYCT